MWYIGNKPDLHWFMHVFSVVHRSVLRFRNTAYSAADFFLYDCCSQSYFPQKDFLRFTENAAGILKKRGGDMTEGFFGPVNAATNISI